MIPSENKFELECKSKQYNDCCDSDTDYEVIGNHNKSSSCDNVLSSHLITTFKQSISPKC